MISLIEGSSIDPDIIQSVKSQIGKSETVLVLLDSNHLKDHVLAELEAYSCLVTPGSYIVACDGVMQQVVGAPRTSADWSWNNPVSAINEFIVKHPEFESVEPARPFNEGKISDCVTYWLKRIFAVSMMSKLSFLSSKISPSKEISGIQYASFDFVSFAIRNLFFDKFSVSDAQEFQSFLLNSSIPDVIQQGHDVIRSSLFIEIFDIFLSELRAIYGDFAHQVLPTFRLQMPGHRSVPFHTDDLSSGHPFDLINVWLPLTKLNFYNSLHFVPAEISASLKDEFVESAKTIEWLDSSSK